MLPLNGTAYETGSTSLSYMVLIRGGAVITVPLLIDCYTPYLTHEAIT